LSTIAPRVSTTPWTRVVSNALSGEIKREQLLNVADVVYKQLNP
jgi:hypothetical protein